MKIVRVIFLYFGFSIILGCASASVLRISNKTPLPVEFAIDGKNSRLSAEDEMIVSQPVENMSNIIFFAELEATGEKIAIKAAYPQNIELSGNNEVQEDIFNLWLPERVNIVDTDSKNGDFLLYLVELTAIRANLRRFATTEEKRNGELTAVYGKFKEFENSLATSEDFEEKETIDKEKKILEAELFIALADDALTNGLLTVANSYFEKIPAEERDYFYRDYNKLNSKLTAFNESLQNKKEDYESIIRQLSSGNVIIADKLIYNFNNNYGSFALHESEFLTKALRNKRLEIDKVRFAIGLGIGALLPLQFNRLADPLIPQLNRYNEIYFNADFLFKIDWRLFSNFFLGARLNGSINFTPFTDNYRHSYFDNKLLTGSDGGQLKALNQVRFRFEPLMGATFGVKLDIEPRWLNTTFPLSVGLNYNFSMLKDFASLYEEKNLWRDYEITMLQSMRPSLTVGYAIFINDNHKFEFLYDFSFAWPLSVEALGINFAEDMPPLVDFMQTQNRFGINYLIFF